MALSLSTVTKPAARALAMLPALPWYGWGALAGLVAAIVLGSRAAGAESGGSGAHGQPGGALPLLKSGASGPWVSFLQGELAIPATGTFDSATDAAVKAYQTANGLTSDGIVGPNTWKALGVKAQGGGGASSKPSPSPSPQTPAPPTTPTPTNPFGLSDTVQTREGQILDYAAQGKIPTDLVPLSWSSGGHSITVMVTRRALAIQDGSGRLSVSMSFNGAQALLDALGLIMPTTKVADEVWKQGTQITPTNQSWNTDKPITGGKTSRMVEQSAAVEKKVAASGDAGPYANEGKWWVMTRHFWNPPQGLGPTSVKGSIHNSANFGLYMPGPGWSKTPGGQNVIQGVGTTHGRGYVDYSQYVFGIAPSVVVDGSTMSAADVLADPALSYLLQDEGGTMPATRHPDL